MPDKLTDEQIVKALECCANCESCDFETTDCPLGEEMECRSLLAEYALDLINRQKAEKTDLLGKIVAKNIVIDTQKAKIERLKEEIERLKPFEDKIAEFNSHIRVEDMLVFTSSLEEWLEFCNNLKSEAYTDFAESLKKEFDNPHIQKFGLDFVKFLKNVVDNRLKKMGDDNA